MPAAKYNTIYVSLRQSIEDGTYPHMLPPEHVLTDLYGCSRNTVRRAIRQLGEEGFVQSVHGKGVLVLYRKREQNQFSIGGVETLKEAAARLELPVSTKVILFEEMEIDAELAAKTGFPAGSEVYHVQRVRYLDGEPLILDHNYFLKSVVRNLTPAACEDSVFEYMEKTLGESIVTTRRKYTVERETELDGQYLDLQGYQCVLMVTNQSFNKDGVMFEYTLSRHRPDRFAFYELAHRKRFSQ